MNTKEQNNRKNGYICSWWRIHPSDVFQNKNVFLWKKVKCKRSFSISIFVRMQGSDPWTETPGEHQPVTIHLSHHLQSSRTLHHPRIWKKARLPPEVSVMASVTGGGGSLSFNWISSVILPLFTPHLVNTPNLRLEDSPLASLRGAWIVLVFALAEMSLSFFFLFAFSQISGTTGHQPGLQLPLQLCNTLAGCPPGPHQHLSYHCCSASHCLHARSDTSGLCGPGYIVRSAGLSTNACSYTVYAEAPAAWI